MNKAKVTSKGQITIPKTVRERLGLRPGDELEFVEENQEFRLKKHLPPNPLIRYRGYLKNLEGSDPDQLVREMRGK